MSFLKEFHYTSISARRMLYAITFLSSAGIALIAADLVVLLHYYFFYLPVFQAVMVGALVSVLLGSLAARLFFGKLNAYRPLFVLVQLLFIAATALYFSRNALDGEATEILMRLFDLAPPVLAAAVSVPFFLYGIVLHYCMKVSCGDFIDDRQAIQPFHLSLLAGLLAGIAVYCVMSFFSLPSLALLALPAMLVPLTVVFDLPYAPPVQYAKEYESEKTAQGLFEPLDRENLILNYINFSLPAMYLYLVYLVILQTRGTLFHLKGLVLLFLVVSCLVGYAAGSLINRQRWNNLQAFYPPLFVVPLMAVYRLGDVLPLWAAPALFVPLVFFFGFVLNQNIRRLLLHYRQKERHDIIELSTVLMPIPIVIALSLTTFTHFWFFFLAYAVCLANIVIPGIFIINKNIALVKKGAYFAYILIFIAAVVFSQAFFPLAMKNDLFIARVKNFKELKNVNYNSPYIKGEALVELNGQRVFSLKDSTVRNLKRALAPLALYYSAHDESRVLFIDGNQRFFRNPSIGFFKKSLCLDPLPHRSVDYATLPFSGKQTYVPDSDDILFFLRRNTERYTIIADITNLADQSSNLFRFSGEYYRLLKAALEKDGIVAQVVNVPGCTSEVLSKLYANVKNTFRYHCVYLFSDVMIVLGSDGGESFQLNQGRLANLTAFMEWQRDEQVLFFDEQHALSRLLFTDIADLKEFLPRTTKAASSLLAAEKKEQFAPDENFSKTYLNRDSGFFSLIGHDGDSMRLTALMKSRYEYNAQILSFLKATEFYESRNNYEKETEYLFELKKRMDYRIGLKEYLVRVLAYKEVSYLSSAQRFVEARNWEPAKRLYESILWINKDNFDANYRLGILSITLQDIDSATLYLQNAMRLKKDDPESSIRWACWNFQRETTPGPWII
jgi:hypothetical protein